MNATTISRLYTIWTTSLVALCLTGCDPADEFGDADTDDTEEVAETEDPGDAEDAEELAWEITEALVTNSQSQESRQPCKPWIMSLQITSRETGGTGAPPAPCPLPAPKP